MPVFKYLDLSTAHLPAAERDKLDDGTAPGIVHPHEHGWRVWVAGHPDFTGNEEERYTDMPALLTCIRFARKHDCYWVLFDSDADVEEELPTYEDEKTEAEVVDMVRRGMPCQH
jgi:hypothetical protein